MDHKMNNQNCAFPLSFYDKYVHDDENLQVKIKPIINQIQESRVIVKELHTKFAIKYSDMMNSYRNRNEELKGSYADILAELKARQNTILNSINELLDEDKIPKQDD